MDNNRPINITINYYITEKPSRRESYRDQKKKISHKYHYRWADGKGKTIKTTIGDEIIMFDDINDAYAVCEKLQDIIAKYGYATLSDLYDLAGMRSVLVPMNEASRLGWTSLPLIKDCIKIRLNGYELALPMPTQIN